VKAKAMKVTEALWAVALLSLASAYGCSSSAEDEPRHDEVSEDELALRRGNIDHAAIVESTTMMLAGGPTAPVLDAYNAEDPFAARSADYAETFARRLAQFDAYDGKTDWTREQAAAWASRVAAGNYQVIDTSKPCDFAAPHTYLEIERAHLTGREHQTCGGRMPNEDALDVTLNFLVGGPAASVDDEGALHDGVERATKPSVATFPYLAELNGL
jgi:hypothetical protein